MFDKSSGLSLASDSHLGMCTLSGEQQKPQKLAKTVVGFMVCGALTLVSICYICCKIGHNLFPIFWDTIERHLISSYCSKVRFQSCNRKLFQMHNFKENTMYKKSTQNNTHLTSILNISLQTLIRRMTFVREYTI